MIALTAFLPVAWAANDGASLYQKRCAPCHGNKGEGKSSTKAPSLVSEKIKKMSDDEIRSLISSRANGEMERDPAHTSLKKRLTQGQVDQILAHLRTLQAKPK